MKRYRFLEALDKIVGTNKRVRCVLVGKDNAWQTYSNGCLRNSQNNELWWPSVNKQKAQIWEVEEEPIYVWGACDSDNLSFLHSDKPELNDDGDWSADKGSELHFKENNIFPKNKPQKYKLEPVEED